MVSYVYTNKYNFVRIEHREAGSSPNEQPWLVDSHALQSALAGILLTHSGTPENLFDADELAELVPQLALALRSAGPDEEVSFAIAGHHGLGGRFSTRSVTTGRVFHKDGRLQIIFGLVRDDFEIDVLQKGYLRPFDPGSRATQISPDASVTVSGDQGSNLRADWLSLLVNTTLRALPAPAVAGASGAADAAGVRYPPASPVLPVGATAPQGADANRAASGAPSAASPMAAGGDSEVDAKAAKIAQRIKILARLRDQGLITDEEFQTRRTQILHEL